MHYIQEEMDIITTCKDNEDKSIGNIKLSSSYSHEAYSIEY
jgi:hypothetical protein